MCETNDCKNHIFAAVFPTFRTSTVVFGTLFIKEMVLKPFKCFLRYIHVIFVVCVCACVGVCVCICVTVHVRWHFKGNETKLWGWNWKKIYGLLCPSFSHFQHGKNHSIPLQTNLNKNNKEHTHTHNNKYIIIRASTKACILYTARSEM